MALAFKTERKPQLMNPVDSLEKLCWMHLVAVPKVEGEKEYPLTFLSLAVKPAYDSLFFSTGAQVFIFHSSPSADHPTITAVCGRDSAG